MLSNDRDVRFQSSKLGYETASCGFPGRFSQRNMRRLTFANGSGASTNPCTILNIAVLAPMPSARVIRHTDVKPGDLPNCRNAYFRSCNNRSNDAQPQAS